MATRGKMLINNNNPRDTRSCQERETAAVTADDASCAAPAPTPRTRSQTLHHPHPELWTWRHGSWESRMMDLLMNPPPPSSVRACPSLSFICGRTPSVQNTHNQFWNYINTVYICNALHPATMKLVDLLIHNILCHDTFIPPKKILSFGSLPYNIPYIW